MSRRRAPVARTVLLLGLVSLATDISSESASAVLPLYLTAGLGLSPLAYGLIDGLYSAASVVVRYLGGWLADRLDRPKQVALTGYAVSALARRRCCGPPGRASSPACSASTGWARACAPLPATS